MLVGCVRVSTDDQDLALPRLLLKRRLNHTTVLLTALGFLFYTAML